jgi:hypothetical protein
MTEVWTTMMDQLANKFVKPLDIKGLPVQKYYMGVSKQPKPESPPANVTSLVSLPFSPAYIKVPSKADGVRNIIRTGRSQQVSQENIIAQVQHIMGMARPLASTYVKNNWNCI